MDALEAMEEEHEARHRRATNGGISRRARSSRSRPNAAAQNGGSGFGEEEEEDAPLSLMSAFFASAAGRMGRGGGGSRRVGGWGASGLGALLMGAMQGQYGNPGGGAGRGRGGSLRETMAGIAHSGLSPGLLLSDRDFTAEDYDQLLRLDEGVENRKGASGQDIEALPTHIVRAPPAGGGGGGGPAGAPPEPPSCCSICLEDVSAGALMRMLPCTHRFHRDCIDPWLKNRATCPICQRKIS